MTTFNSGKIMEPMSEIIVEVDEKQAARVFAKMGGMALLEKRGPNHFVLMGKKSGEVRRKKRDKRRGLTNSGTLFRVVV